MITDKEIRGFWRFYIWFLIQWNAVSLFALLTFPLTFPIALLLKYKLGVRGIWFLNDTEDGDFGDPAIVSRYGYNNKSKFFLFWWWWFRNHSWNFNRRFAPDWNRGLGVEFRTIKRDLPKGESFYTWCSKDGVHGINYVAYRVYKGGRVMCRYSRANSKSQRQYGAGGNEYRFRW